MNQTRILLADLAHTYSVANASLTMPLGIGYVKAYAVSKLENSVDIRLFKHPDRFLAAVRSEQPEIIGFANYGWNQNLNREIGRHVRRMLPDAIIVAGGPNIDPDPARRLSFLKRHDYLDYLIIDGGEEPFTELITWWRDASRQRDLLPSNIVWRDGDELKKTLERTLKKNIQDLPSPYLGGHLDEFIEAGLVPLFETNRGCPFRCTFCAWGSASKDLVRRINVNQALAEIEYVGERSSARHWIICDANFGILKRDIEIAQAVRNVKDAKDRPRTCDIWLAKNSTDRCLEIGKIFGDMAIPVMAVQSLADQVLKYIKRDNISLDTFEQYQRQFHRIGSRTYSDLIVPLPGETLDSHLSALRTLIGMEVDIIQSHNMRLLAGAETNAAETRERFKFRTAYRLIHGDAGIYGTPDGNEIRAFEFEESLRSTDTMTEVELFYLRKLHFLVELAWNIEVYKPLLNAVLLYEISPLDVLIKLLDGAEHGGDLALKGFFSEFDKRSREEWYTSAQEIETKFYDPGNFEKLINCEYEKLNIQFSIIALRDYKQAFDRAIVIAIADFSAVPEDVLGAVADVSFSLFPPLNDQPPTQVMIPRNLLALDGSSAKTFKPSEERRAIPLTERRARRELRSLISGVEKTTISKILNTQCLSLRDLRLVPGDGTAFEAAFRRSV